MSIVEFTVLKKKFALLGTCKRPMKKIKIDDEK